MRRREMLDHKMFAMNSANQSSIIQLIEGMQEIKLNACEQTKHWEWERIQRNLYRLSLKGLKLAQYQQLSNLHKPNEEFVNNFNGSNVCH